MTGCSNFQNTGQNRNLLLEVICENDDEKKLKMEEDGKRNEINDFTDRQILEKILESVSVKYANLLPQHKQFISRNSNFFL